MYLARLEQQLQAFEVDFFSSFDIISPPPSPATVIDAWVSQNTWNLFSYLMLNLEDLKVSPYSNYFYWAELEMENVTVGNIYRWGIGNI